MRKMEKNEEMTRLEMFARITKVISYLGIACLLIGFSLFLLGHVLVNLFVSQIGVYLLLAGIGLLALIAFGWLINKILEHGPAKG